MSSNAAELNRLALLVERLLDAELLLDADGARLLTETNAARHSLEAQDMPSVRQHVEQLVLFTEALVHSAALDRENGRAIIETAIQILDDQTL